jgi:hypothetical protein
MKTKLLLTSIALASGAITLAQYPISVPPTTVSAPGVPGSEPPPALPPQSPDQLEQLLAPIALYPDPLLAVLLPAATTPSDVTLAARLVRSTNDPSLIDAQPWDDSVKALAHYPEVVGWMDDNLEWTKQLGAAFLQQPADVMNAVQRLRSRAQQAGMLTNTPQQQVVVENNVIYVEPAQPDVIYVPSYDPDIFTSAGWGPRRGGLSFGLALSMGPWLDYDFDWSRRTVWVDRNRDWRRMRDARAIVQTQVAPSPERQVWRPRVDVSRQATHQAYSRVQPEIVRPAPISTRSATWSRDRSASYPPEATRRGVPAAGPSVAPTGRVYGPSAPPTPSYSTTPAPVPATPSQPATTETPRLQREREWRRPAAVPANAQPVYTTPTPVPPREEHAPRAEPRIHQLPPQAAPPAQARVPAVTPAAPGTPQVVPAPSGQENGKPPPGRGRGDERKRDKRDDDDSRRDR